MILENGMPITAAQARGARAMLGLHQEDLAKQAGVTRSTLATFEAGGTSPHEATLQRIQVALETAGAVFVETDAGVGVIVAATT